jgi:diguanylate cyclase (GGDEF)-like protein
MARRANIGNGVGLALAALIFIAVGVGVLLGAQRFITDARYVAHTNEVIASIDAFEARLRDAESAQRGYLLTSDVDYLASYRVNHAQLDPLLDELASMVADNPDQVARIEQMKQLQQRRLEQINGNLARYRLGGLEEAKAGINAQVLEVSSSMRVLARQMIEHERGLLVQRDRSSRRSALVLRALALLGIPLGILVLSGVFWRLLHEVRQRGYAERASEQMNDMLRDSVERLEQHSSGLAELNRYASMLQNCIHVEEAVQLSTQLLSKLLPNSGGTLYRIRASRDYAEEVTHWGQHVVDSETMLPPTDCWGLRRSQLHQSDNTQHKVLCAHVKQVSAEMAAATTCIPLTAQGVQLGFIYISSAQPVAEDRLDLLQALAEQLSMALHNISLQERLRVQSIRDPLTGLFNRRYLEESLARELARCERRGLPFSLLMLDVDHFKAFNDQQGHPGGDALLEGLGQVLRTQSRAEDIACRYGGEEFTLILPETNMEQARRRAEEIAASVRTMRIEHMGHTLPTVTASIGVASYAGTGDSGEALLARADRALYRAKREGRDRTVADGDPATV